MLREKSQGSHFPNSNALFKTFLNIKFGYKLGEKKCFEKKGSEYPGAL